MSKKIKVHIAADGAVTYETVGFSGNSCKDVSKFIEKGLGTKTSDKNTKECRNESEEKTSLEENA